MATELAYDEIHRETSRQVWPCRTRVQNIPLPGLKVSMLHVRTSQLQLPLLTLAMLQFC